MKYCSTRGQCPPVGLKEAVLTGLAADGGLYVPEKVPSLSAHRLGSLRGRSLTAIGLHIAEAFVGREIPAPALHQVVERSLDFPVPLTHLGAGIHALELFHGPSLAFKDFGARFMAELMRRWVGESSRESTVLTATSGDTGSAVALGFYRVPGIRVVVLYPSGRISRVQEQQITTLGENVLALEVEGDFDDCQRLVKEAFADPELRRQTRLTTANSINPARLIPQIFYFFYAWSRLPQSSQAPLFSVPSGNFGNLTAGLIAKRMGLPVSRFVAATNRNDVFPRYLQGGRYRPGPSITTLSNAMDVGAPSNFERIKHLYKGDLAVLRRHLSARSFEDDQTLEAIRDLYQDWDRLVDPHGAVAYLGMKSEPRTKPALQPGIYLETAHPAKFPDIVKRAAGVEVPIPERLARFLTREKKSVRIAPKAEALRELLA